MGFIVLILVVFAIALISKSFVGFSMVLPFVLAIAFHFPANSSFVLAFISGLIVSFVEGTTLGKDSFGMLLATGILYLYGKRFSEKHWAFFAVFVAIGSGLYMLVSDRVFAIWKVGVDVILAAVFLFLVAAIRKRFFSESIHIKV